LSILGRRVLELGGTHWNQRKPRLAGCYRRSCPSRGFVRTAASRRANRGHASGGTSERACPQHRRPLRNRRELGRGPWFRVSFVSCFTEGREGTLAQATTRDAAIGGRPPQGGSGGWARGLENEFPIGDKAANGRLQGVVFSP
jgi:hypothetical protein